MGAKNMKSGIIKNLASLIIILSIANPAMADFGSTYPYPVYGTATVDGSYGEWDLTNDFFADMYNAGDSSKEVLSKLYLRYDQNQQILYALVLLDDDEMDDGKTCLIDSPEDQWIKLYNEKTTSGQVILDGNSAADHFQYVYEDPSTKDRIIGWEGSVSMVSPVEYYNEFEVHAQIDVIDDPDCTSSTGKGDFRISLVIPVPEFPTVAVPVIMVLGMMFIFQCRKK